MSDSFREVTTRGYGSRIMDSIKGILIGVVLFLAAFPVLFINEGCSVRDYRKWKQGGKECIPLAEARVLAANEGKLIHFSADATTDEVLRDSILGVEANAISLRRTVKMYQWRENQETKTKKNVGGSETRETIYTYDKVWSESLIDSSKFKKSGHSNPTDMAYSSDTFLANRVTAGDFNLPQSLIVKIKNATTLEMDTELVEKLPEALRQKGQTSGNAFFVGANPSAAQIGDLMFSFDIIRPPQRVSIMAEQTGNTLKAFMLEGGHIERLDMGTFSKDEMVAKAQDENRIRTWIIRVVGFFMMFIGISLVLKPLSIMADVIPFIGNIVGMGSLIIAIAVALPLSLITIAVAWIVYRPLLAIPLLLIAAMIIGFLIYKGINSRKTAVEA